MGQTETAPTGVLGKYMGNNTCRYTGLNYAKVEGSENVPGGSFSFQGVAVGPAGSQHVQTRNWAFAPPLVTREAWGASFAGISVAIPGGSNWPSSSSVTVAMPWAAIGIQDVNGAPGGSSAQSKVIVRIRVFGGGRSDTQTVYSKEVTTAQIPPGPKTSNTNTSGNGTVSTNLDRNTTFTSYVRNYTQSVAAGGTYAASAETNFATPDGDVATTYQEWRFTLPSGWVITRCV